jgi:hypothetical protein
MVSASFHRVNRRVPRGDDRTKVLPDTVIVCSPLSSLAYVPSNAVVAQAALVHARFGPTVSVDPERVNAPLQVLQSARVEKRPSPRVTV